MADITEAIRRLIFEYVSEGAEKVMQTQEAVAASTTKTDKASLSLEKSFGSLERRYVDTVRHQQDYQKVQEKVNAAVAQNPALQERANVVLAAAGEHFDKLAANAGKGGVAASFLSKAISTIIGPAGLLGVAMTGVGVAVGYMADQFLSSSKTIEESLKEQERLFSAIKTQIDAKASAEAKAQAQSLNVSILQNVEAEIDLRRKLTKVMEDQAAIIAREALTPTKAPGAMGAIQPMAAEALPGYQLIVAAQEKYNAAVAAGQPGLKAFHDQIAAIALRHPELKAMVTQMIAAGQAGIQLEQAGLKTKALSDYLAGVATNAQFAAAGLRSIAEFQLSNVQIEQAAAASERQAKATSEIALMYPGMSVEVAKQLYGLEQQLTVAQARTGAEKIVAQEIATQNTLLAQGKTLEEAIAVAAKQRELAETNAKNAVQSQIKGLQDQLALIEARRNGTENLVKQEQIYQKVLDDTGDKALATQKRLAQNRIDDANDRDQAERAAGQRQQAINAANEQAIQDYNASMERALASAQQMAHHWAQIPGIITEIIRVNGEWIAQSKNLPQFKTWTNAAGQAVQFNPEGYALEGNLFLEAQKKALGEGNYEIRQFGPMATVVPSKDYLARQKEGTGPEIKLNDSIEKLTSSTDSLNATMQDALSPYYSQDPRTTKLGFRAGVVGNPDWMAPGASNVNPLAAILGPGATAPGMADGGSFVVGGGYSSNDNRIAAFPVASGEEIVVNRSRQQDRGATVVNIDNRTIIQGSVDEDTMAKLKVTQYQQSQRMRGALARA